MTNESKKELENIATSLELKTKLSAIMTALNEIPSEKEFSDTEWQQLLLRKQELMQQAEQADQKPIPIPILRKHSKLSSRDLQAAGIELGQVVIRIDQNAMTEEQQQAEERKKRYSSIVDSLPDVQLKLALQSFAATVIDEMVQLIQIDIPAYFRQTAKKKAIIGADEYIAYLDAMVRELIAEKKTTRTMLAKYCALLERVQNRIMPSINELGEPSYVLVMFNGVFSRNVNPLQWDVLKEEVDVFLQFVQGPWVRNDAIFSKQLLALGKLLAAAHGKEDAAGLIQQRIRFLASILKENNYSLKQLENYAEIFFTANMNLEDNKLSREVESVFKCVTAAIDNEISRQKKIGYFQNEPDNDTKEIILNLHAPLPPEYHQLMKLIQEARNHGNGHSNHVVAETLLNLTSQLQVRAFAYYKNNDPGDEVKRKQFCNDIKSMINIARPILIKHRANVAIRLLTHIRALFYMAVHAIRYGIFGSYSRIVDDYAHRRTKSRAITRAISDLVEKNAPKPAKRKALKRRNY
jgi:hypothetical protein